MTPDERRAFLDRVNKPRTPRSDAERLAAARGTDPEGRGRPAVLMHGSELVVTEKRRAEIVAHQDRDRDDNGERPRNPILDAPAWVNQG